jgi:hypothetical protein
MAHYIWATRINAVTGRTVTGILRSSCVIPNSGKAEVGEVAGATATPTLLYLQVEQRVSS